MRGVFAPRLSILPAAQQRLWPELRRSAELGFALYGGTAIALRLGHRPSVDFDFFSEMPLNRDAIAAALVYFEDGDLDTLGNGEKATLVRAASAVRDLPSVAIVARQLTAAA